MVELNGTQESAIAPIIDANCDVLIDPVETTASADEAARDSQRADSDALSKRTEWGENRRLREMQVGDA